jgi:integral membrane protein (TIGR01906 family)
VDDQANQLREFHPIFRSILQILIPIVLMLTSIHLILATALYWIPIEYRKSKFPADPYGFTVKDRIYWSAVDINYLINNTGIEYFDDYHLPDGKPMHVQRELSHMDDVKTLIVASRWAWGIGIALIGLLLTLMRQLSDPADVGMVLRRGARNTLVLMGILIIGLIVGFNVVFVGFHRIFFYGDTWIFHNYDTFIRLYPQLFWQDCFILLVLASSGLAGLIEWIGRRMMKPTIIVDE